MNTSSLNPPFNLELTKKICICSFISILIVILFIISPLSHLINISIFMKFVALIILIYTIYLSIFQTNILKQSYGNSNHPSLSSQININIICSYIFTLFLAILFLFILRNMIFDK
jgi:hypothetical protein